MSIKQNTPAPIAMAIGSSLNANAEQDHAVFTARETIKNSRKASKEIEKNINSDIAMCRKGSFTKDDFFETSHKEKNGTLYTPKTTLFTYRKNSKKESYSKIENRSAVFAELRKSKKSLDAALEIFFDIKKCSKFAMAMLTEALASGGTFDTAVKHVSAITKLCSQKTGLFSFNPASAKTKITLTIDVAPIASGEQKVEDRVLLAADALEDYLDNKKNVAKLLSAFPRATHAVIKKALMLK